MKIALPTILVESIHPISNEGDAKDFYEKVYSKFELLVYKLEKELAELNEPIYVKIVVKD